MKQLVLLRHGPALPNSEQLDDIKRELTSEGKQRVIHTAKELQKKAFIPQRIFSSPAMRTMQTAEIVIEVFAEEKLHIEIQPTLYAATLADLLIFIETLPDDCENIILIGHNPGISECASLLAKYDLAHLAPADYCWLQWSKNTPWQSIANGIAQNVKINR